MGFSKSYGPVTIAESGGNVTVSAQLKESVGGGPLAGVVQAQASVGIQIGGLQLADAGLLWLEGKFPQFSAEIALLKAAVDAEAAKI